MISSFKMSVMYILSSGFRCWPPNPKLSWSHPQNGTVDFLLAWVTTFSIMSVLNVTVRLFFQKYYFHRIIFYLVTCYNFLYPHKSTSNFWAKKALLLISPFLVSSCVHQSALCCNLSIRMGPWFWLSLSRTRICTQQEVGCGLFLDETKVVCWKQFILDLEPVLLLEKKKLVYSWSEKLNRIFS